MSVFIYFIEHLFIFQIEGPKNKSFRPKLKGKGEETCGPGARMKMHHIKILFVELSHAYV